MFFRSFRVPPLLWLTALTLGGQSVGLAEERPQSLYEKRLSIIRGTSPGIVIYGAEKPAAPVSAPVPVSAPAPVAVASAPKALKAESKPVAESVPQVPSLSERLSTLPRLSGRSMHTARSLGTGEEGIKIPTAPTVPRPTAEPAGKP